MRIRRSCTLVDRNVSRPLCSFTWRCPSYLLVSKELKAQPPWCYFPLLIFDYGLIGNQPGLPTQLDAWIAVELPQSSGLCHSEPCPNQHPYLLLFLRSAELVQKRLHLLGTGFCEESCGNIHLTRPGCGLGERLGKRLYISAVEVACAHRHLFGKADGADHAFSCGMGSCAAKCSREAQCCRTLRS